MRILHVTKKYPNALGGDAIVVQNLEKQQMKNGHEVFILTTNCDEIINKPNLIKFGLKDSSEKLDTITFKRIASLISLYLKSFKIIKSLKPQVVHSHSIDIGFALSSACKRYSIPIINTCHGGLFSISNRDSKRSAIERFLIKKAKFKIITTPNKKDTELKKKKYGDVVYVPNGIDTSKFKEAKNKKTNKVPKILFVGRIDRQKGLDYLIKSAELLKKKGIKFCIELVGDGKDMKLYKETVDKKRLNAELKFAGKKSPEEISQHYQNADIFILPSLDEAFPITLLEAWASKLPVVITNVGGISGICTNKENALVIAPKNSEAIAKSVSALIESPNLRKRLARNGLREVKKYSWDRINKKFEGVYQTK